ncbi:MAG: hypothetical protein E7425_09910 [Ruminococcaceae bacterium]|nr:hypothetical protein [Oscillospiraceae bacterium]
MKIGWVYLGYNCSADPEGYNDTEKSLYSPTRPHLLHHPDVGKTVLAGKAKMVNSAWSVKKPDGITADYTEESSGWYPEGREVEVEYTVWNHRIGAIPRKAASIIRPARRIRCAAERRGVTQIAAVGA